MSRALVLGACVFLTAAVAGATQEKAATAPATSQPVKAATQAVRAEPLKSGASANGQFRLEIVAGNPVAHQRPRARLTEVSKARKDRVVWDRPLRNDVAPEIARVADDGRYVVTLDEFERGGARHALVVYTRQGRLATEFRLEELLQGEDWGHVRIEGKVLRWLTRARCEFDDATHFTVHLAWGREIVIDLSGPCVSGAQRQPPLRRRKDVPTDIMVLLGDGTENVLPGVVRSQPEQQQQRGATASATGSANAAIPPPNPRQPVDYVTVLNGLTGTSDVNAEAEYLSAVDALRETGTVRLGFAASGDRHELFSDEFAAWLAENGPAIDHFRAATQFAFRGWLRTSTDGSLLHATLFPSAALRALAWGTVGAGRCLAATGNLAEGIQHCLDALAAGAQIGQSPVIQDTFMSISIQASAAEALLDILAGADPAAVEYSVFMNEVAAAYAPTRRTEETAEASRAQFYDVLQQIYRSQPGSAEYEVDESVVRSLGYGSPTGEESIKDLRTRGFDRTVREADAFFDEVHSALAAPDYESGYKKMTELQARLGRGEFPALLTPAAAELAGRYTVAARNRAVRDGLLLVAHIHAYKQVRGALPATLDEIWAGASVDPNVRFVYVRDGGDFTLRAEVIGDDGHGSDTRWSNIWPRQSAR